MDPLADTAACSRDIPLLEKLGVNAIRTYAINPKADHTHCMSMLEDAGIYVISDLGEPSVSIDRSDPQWTTTLLDRYTAVVDTLAPYSNVIGFFAGNEVPNNLTYTGSSAMVKAAVRDTKAYIKSKNYRPMGVGYAADDDQTVRANVASYFVCGEAESQIDFWGYNIYEWCGDSDFETSGYADRVKEFADYHVPSFFAEYGCNTNGGAAKRKFTEVAALYGEKMTPVFSGGIVYEWFQEKNDYGLASVVNPSKVSTLADYAAFSTQIGAVKPKATNAASYTPTNTANQACPTVGDKWNAASALPPTPNKETCACMMSTLSCKANADIDPLAIGPLFGQVCGYNDGKACAGIARDTKTGSYGAFSMCNATEQLSIAFNAYYNSISGSDKSKACDFGGNATVVTPASSESSCSSVLSSASSAATAGGSNGQGASSTKKSDAAGIVGASLGIGKYAMVGFTLMATFSGMGMILL